MRRLTSCAVFSLGLYFLVGCSAPEPSSRFDQPLEPAVTFTFAPSQQAFDRDELERVWSGAMLGMGQDPQTQALAKLLFPGVELRFETLSDASRGAMLAPPEGEDVELVYRAADHKPAELARSTIQAAGEPVRLTAWRHVTVAFYAPSGHAADVDHEVALDSELDPATRLTLKAWVGKVEPHLMPLRMLLEDYLQRHLRGWHVVATDDLQVAIPAGRHRANLDARISAYGDRVQWEAP
jgi:hypothetical protein